MIRPRFFTFVLLVACFPSLKAQQPPAHQTRIGDDLYKKIESKLDFFSYDSTYRVVARFDPSISTNEPFTLPVSTGKPSYFMEFGRLLFEMAGKEYRLTVYRPWPVTKYNRHVLFLPFRDQTHPSLTYPAGRYLPISMDNFGDDGLILDFNQAHNPLCAYDPTYACPIPPRENQLDLPIFAGEKRPKN
jgi:uncharacterized protein